MENGQNDHHNGGSSSGTKKQPMPAPALTLERVIGQTCLHNSALAVNPVTGDVAYPAGCVVVIYQPRHNRQSRFFHSTKAVSCLSFSTDGTYLAVGERGHQPSIVVWSLGSGLPIAELKNGHRFGVSCLTFSPAGNFLVSVGFKYDRQIRVWDLDSAIDAVATTSTSSPNIDTTSSKSCDPSSDEASRPSFLMASANVSQKVRSVVVSQGGTFFVTCGDRHVKFWNIEDGGVGKKGEEGKEEEEKKQPSTNGKDISAITLTGHTASTLEGLSDSIFMDVACCQGEDGIDTVYAVTSSAVLCVFSTQHVMERWINLEANNAYSLSVCGRLLCIGCSNGILRLFDAGSLQFIVTLPKPPPFGRANLASTSELKTLIESYATTPVGSTEQNNKHQHMDVGLSYASVLGVRLSPSRTKVVAIYADRTLIMWDITDTHNVSKYHSFLSHSTCIWDIQCIPSRSCGSSNDNREAQTVPSPSMPDGTVVTCSADNTIRVWNINELDGSSVTRDGVGVGEGAESTVSKMWVNLYSQHLLRILYVNSLDGGVSEVSSHNSSPDECGGGRGYEHENVKEKVRHSQCFGIPDVETLPTSNSPMSPRSLAVHPDGLQLACGDKQGNIRVYDLHVMKLLHSQAAHDGEVLCMDYSPAMELQTGNDAAAGGRIDEVVGNHDGESWLAVKPYHPLIISSRNANSKAADADSAMPESLKRNQQLVLLASASRDRLVHIFNASGKISGNEEGNKALNHGSYPLLETITDHSSSVTAIKFSNDGRRIATTGGDRTLILNNLCGCQIRKLKTIPVPQGTIYGLDVDPTSKYLISTGQDKKVNIWSLATGNLARTYSPVDKGSEGGWGEMYKVDLDPTGIYVAICSFDKSIRLFDFYSGRCLCKVSGHSELVTGIRFTLDGKRLVSIGGDGCIFIWRLSTVLQQVMHDRLCEMYPECEISTNKVGETGAGKGPEGGRASPVNRDTEVALNRAKAKEGAKARLKLHKSQLSWVQTIKPQPQNGTGDASDIVIDSNKLSHQVRSQDEPEEHSLGTFEVIKSSPKESKYIVSATKMNRWALIHQQEGSGGIVHAEPIDSSSFSQDELIDAPDDAQSTHFEDSCIYNCEEDSQSLKGKEKCSGEGTDKHQQDMPYGDGKEENYDEEDNTSAVLASVPETLYTPSSQPVLRHVHSRADSVKCNSEIDDGESSSACYQSSPRHLCDESLITSPSCSIPVTDMFMAIERTKMVDETNEIMGVIEAKNEDEVAILQQTQESCCFTASISVKGGTEMKRDENTREPESIEARESASKRVQKEGIHIIDVLSNSGECEAKYTNGENDVPGNLHLYNQSSDFLNNKTEERSSKNETNNISTQSNEQMLLDDDLGLCTTADVRNSKSAAGIDCASPSFPTDSYALELPHPPDFSQDKDVMEDQDKDIPRMHAKRKETEVRREMLWLWLEE